jgi:hypothetical protein
MYTIEGHYSSGYEQFYLLGHTSNFLQFSDSQLKFQRSVSFPPSELKSSQARNQQEASSKQ